MSDGRRRRYSKTKQVERRPITLARREDNRAELDTQPRILLKTKVPEEGGSSGGGGGDAPLKTIIVTRSSDAPGSGQPSSTSSSQHMPAISPVNMRGEQQTRAPSEGATSSSTTSTGTANAIASTLLIEPVPQMTRAATVVSSTGLVNANAKKLLDKTNNDFLVVGVIGTQGVGKSTIMNLLANEQRDFDYYKRVFVDEDGVFPTKLKPHKCSARSRTESTHMFITSDRMILLDSPPVLCNSYKKDMTTNELDDLRHIISFLSVCHLVIVVQDDYINMNFLRLLQLAELMKPMHDTKPFNADYFPHLMFVKNRAKRSDYDIDGKAILDNMLCAFFKDTQLRVFLDSTPMKSTTATTTKSSTAATTTTTTATTKSTSADAARTKILDAEQRRKEEIWPRTVEEPERLVNSFLLPEVTSGDARPEHEPLDDIVDKLRKLVYMTPRNEMYAGASASELNECVWFDLLTKVAQDTHHFFFKTYESIQRRHLDLGNGTATASGSGGGGANSYTNARDKESWRDK